MRTNQKQKIIMKKTIPFSLLLFAAIALSFSACKKDKKDPENPSDPPPVTNDQEVVTTLRIYIWDSVGSPIAGSPFSFKDPDGDGGASGTFLNGGADSVIILFDNSRYLTRVVILDETKTPADSVSNEVGGDESYEHLLFYNGDPANASNTKGNQVLNAAYPDYQVKLNGSGITVRYTDTDNGVAHGQPARNIGLTTELKTLAATNGTKYPFIVTLRHQPDAKDGSYAPGETDVEVMFKVRVN
jgi:hypothetical protein